MEKKCRDNEDLIDNADNSKLEFNFTHLSNVFSENENHININNLDQEKVLYPSATEVIYDNNNISNIIDNNNSNSNIVIHYIAPLQEQDRHSIDQRIKYLLSFAHNVGAHRYNQAYKDLIDAYSAGISFDDLDEISEMFVHYQKIGETVSEIGPWPIFDAYQLIREFEQKGLPREEIIQYLNNRFNDKIIRFI
jgi:hypothetical protein